MVKLVLFLIAILYLFFSYRLTAGYLKQGIKYPGAHEECEIVALLFGWFMTPIILFRIFTQEDHPGE